MLKNPISFESRLLRAVWTAVYVTLFWPTPRCCHRWRIYLLRLFGAKVHLRARVYPRASIWAPWNLICEADACIGEEAILYNQALIWIQKGATVSQKSFLCTGTHDYTKASFPLQTAPITVGESVWVAAGAFVAPGVELATGCVIGAYSVVTRNMPAWTVCAGNPCRPIKPRVYDDKS